jgi:hypothetical protein
MSDGLKDKCLQEGWWNENEEFNWKKVMTESIIFSMFLSLICNFDEKTESIIVSKFYLLLSAHLYSLDQN